MRIAGAELEHATEVRRREVENSTSAAPDAEYVAVLDVAEARLRERFPEQRVWRSPWCVYVGLPSEVVYTYLRFDGGAVQYHSLRTRDGRSVGGATLTEALDAF